MNFSDASVRNYHISEVSRINAADINSPVIAICSVKSQCLSYTVRSSLSAASAFDSAVVRHTEESEFHTLPVKRLKYIESARVFFIVFPFVQFRSVRLKQFR